jgi:hypothetical protein
MTPAALLAIVALGMVLAYVIPQRIKERSDYALVRTEDRYSAEMRVVKASARRVEASHSRPSSDSGGVPLLVTGAARASILALGQSNMSRPAGPLDRAATSAARERIALRGDRATVLVERRAVARRRARVALLSFVLAAAAWILAAATAFPVVLAAIATGAFAGIVVAGARAAHAQRVVDARLNLVAREVEAAATATQALRRVTQERARGVETEPSDVETQAIRVVTTEDLAPLAAPAPVPSPALPAKSDEDGGIEWSPRDMPAPAYTLKQTVRPAYARPLTESDYAAASYAPAPTAAEAPATTSALDEILARRRRASA